MSDIKWLMTRQIPHLRRYARALTRDESSADDLVQDTLEQALRKRWAWRREGSVRSWLFSILYHRFIDERRRLRRRTPVALDDIPPDIRQHSLVQPAAAEHSVECDDAVRALERLPEAQRAAIVLVALEDIDYDEAAGILDIPVGTLRSRLSRGREALRAMMQGRGNRRVGQPPLTRVK